MNTRQSKRGTRPVEGGWIGEAVFVLLILSAIVGGCIWLYFNYVSSTDSEARDYVEQVVRKLTVDHDAKYLARNLSEKGQMDFGYSRQQQAMQSLTRLGAPRRPFQINGKVAYRSEAGPKEPIGRFQTFLHYPTAEGELDLDVARRNARWEIDSIIIQWKDFLQSPSPAPSP